MALCESSHVNEKRFPSATTATPEPTKRVHRCFYLLILSSNDLDDQPRPDLLNPRNCKSLTTDFPPRDMVLGLRMRAWQRLRLPLLIVGLALWVAWNNGLLPSLSWSRTAEDSSKKTRAADEKTRKQLSIESAILKQSGHVVADECSPTTGHCYVITDEVRRRHGKLVAQRLMHLNKLPGYVFTAVNLRTPEALTWKNSMVRDWPVDKLIVDSVYCQMQIAVGFITEALTFDNPEKQQVLMIGLGGGVSSSFLSILHELDIRVETTVVELDPFIVDLAEKYFDHGNVPGVTNVVVADGIKFLQEAVKNGTKYRSILLDACYNDDATSTGLLCPIREFLTIQTIQNVFDALEDDGVMSANTISHHSAAHHEKEALQQFQKVFPSCYLAPYQAARNMLVCSKRENWTWEEQRKKFLANLEAVIARFDFTHLQYLRHYYP